MRMALRMRRTRDWRVLRWCTGTWSRVLIRASSSRSLSTSCTLASSACSASLGEFGCGASTAASVREGEVPGERRGSGAGERDSGVCGETCSDRAEQLSRRRWQQPRARWGCREESPQEGLSKSSVRGTRAQNRRARGIMGRRRKRGEKRKSEIGTW